MSVVGERTAEESSPPGVVEEPGVSRGLHFKFSNIFGGLWLLFWDILVLLGDSVNLHQAVSGQKMGCLVIAGR